MRHIIILSDFRTMAIGLFFFLLSNYWNIQYRIGEFKKLSEYQISDLGLNLSDYRISDSEKTIGCPPLFILYVRQTKSFRLRTVKFRLLHPGLLLIPRPRPQGRSLHETKDVYVDKPHRLVTPAVKVRQDEVTSCKPRLHLPSWVTTCKPG